eukprot:1211691-Amorphochlora_amoeboformis.AAC.1
MSVKATVTVTVTVRFPVPVWVTFQFGLRLQLGSDYSACLSPRTIDSVTARDKVTQLALQLQLGLVPEGIRLQLGLR